MLGTYVITNDPKYKLVVETVTQLRGRLLNDQAFRRPILALFKGVYEDTSEFPEELKAFTPAVDHRSNLEKIKEIRSHHPPSDDDVLEFLMNSFPDLYLELGNFGPAELLWGETRSGRGEFMKEEITINLHLVELWLEENVSVRLTIYYNI